MGDSWLIEVENELKQMVDSVTEPLKTHSIYRIPAFIADLKRNIYSPHAVSFGPYHHGGVNLNPMESHKQRSLVHFLERTQTSLQTIVNSFAEVADELKNSYDSLDPAWKKNTKRFLKLMIVDGCFMLEIFKAYSNTLTDYARDDPIFGDHGKVYVMPVIKRDMLMLENQLPMLVLDKLLAISDNNAMKDDKEYINKLILKFCNPGTSLSTMGTCLHVLDLFRKSLFRKESQDITSKQKKEDPHGDAITRSATELNEAGVRFKRIKSHSLNHISFKGGVLKLPTFVIDDTTESAFLNMIAFERCHVGAGNEVTSYICFMDNLIDGSIDIRHLQSKNIVQNFIGSDKGAADLFNTISKDLTIDPASSLGFVHWQVTTYCSKRRNRWRANLIHTYFTNPWTLISVIAAVVLFALTITQTVYSVLSYNQ